MRYILLVFLLGGSDFARAEYVLGANDMLHVTVFGSEDMTGDFRIASSGKISFPLLGEVTVGGLTTVQAEKAIASRLAEQGYIRNPQVNVMVREFHSQEVAVLGYVSKPGRYALETENSVAALIALAGGVNEQGDDRAIISRVVQGKLQRSEMDLKGLLENGNSMVDVPVKAGDIIFVPRAPLFYIYGEVQRPGSYHLEREMSVAQALSVGGGLTPRGSQNRVTVKRNVNGEKQELEVELTDFLKKDDVVYVGERWF